MDAFIELFKLELAQRLSGIADGLAATKVRTHKSHSRTGKEYTVREHERAGGKKKAKQPLTPFLRPPQEFLPSGPGKIDPRSQREITYAWHQLRVLFPTVVGSTLKGVVLKKFARDDWTFGETSNDGSRIHLNGQLITQRKMFLRGMQMNERDGFFPKGSSRFGWAYVVAHEFGHAVFTHLHADPSTDAWIKMWTKASGKQLRQISDYATWDENEGFAETFAHTFLLRGRSSYRDFMLGTVKRARRIR